MCIRDRINTEGRPSNDGSFLAIWTGEEMIVWGRSEGARYNPTTDKWTALSAIGAPSPRFGATSVWTGEEMIIWGGRKLDYSAYLNDGARYRPASDTWS